MKIFEYRCQGDSKTKLLSLYGIPSTFVFYRHEPPNTNRQGTNYSEEKHFTCSRREY